MAFGWGNLFGGIGELLGKIPIQGRKERWKNELDSSTQERVTLLKGRATVKMADRVNAIDRRIAELNRLLKNSATD